MKYKLVFASHNKHKVQEMKNILEPFGIELLSLSDINVNIVDIEENGTTYEENSYIKAKEIAKHSDYPIIADDSGLEIDALNGKPGINSARFAKSFNGHLNAMKNIINETNEIKTARFVCVITLIENGNVYSFKGIAEGRIIDEFKGENGFGYDPIFFSLEANKTFSELSDADKNKYSHRAKAAHKLINFLKENNKI